MSNNPYDWPPLTLTPEDVECWAVYTPAWVDDVVEA